MDKPNKKPIIGILGGIGSGKSTVAAEFAKLGCKVIDADKIAHQLLDQDTIKQKVLNLCGEKILGVNSKIDHAKLADIVFNDPDKLSQLNSILHPVVLTQIQQLIDTYDQQPETKAIVLDIPLLLEIDWGKKCKKLIFVKCDDKIRAERFKKRRLFDKNQLKIRENFQISLDKKINIADNIIDNNSGFSALVKQVADVFSDIVGNG